MRGANGKSWLVVMVQIAQPGFLQSLREDENRPIAEEDEQAIPKLFRCLNGSFFSFTKRDRLVLSRVRQGRRRESDSTSGTFGGSSAFQNGMFDEASLWVGDFDAAVELDSAYEYHSLLSIGLKSKAAFFPIVVVGLRGEGELKRQESIEKFCQDPSLHGGFEFLPYGTPTNNSSNGSSGHSASEEQLLASFDFEVLSPLRR